MIDRRRHDDVHPGSFLLDAYATERLKTLTVWSCFVEEDLRFRPAPRARSPLEHMVHQCISEDTWMRNMLGVLTLVPKAGPTVRLSVSTATGLILQRETEGETVVFSDYRPVDGERLPFRSTITDALGETTVEVEQARFGVSIEDTAFAPGK